jgi:uncharacterized membrane protein YfcA
MKKFMSILKGVGHVAQVVGVGVATTAITDPTALNQYLPPKYQAATLATSVIINALAPSLANLLKKKANENAGLK